MLGPSGRDRGEGASSYLAVTLLIASVVAVLVTAIVPDHIVGAVSRGVCQVAGDQGCATGPAPTAPSTPRGNSPSSVPSPDGPEADYREAQDAYDRLVRETAGAEDDWTAFDLAEELAALGLDFLIGDIKRCLQDPSLLDCLWALVGLVPWTKLGKLLKSIPAIAKLANRFLDLRSRLALLRKSRDAARTRLDEALEACRKRGLGAICRAKPTPRDIARTVDVSTPRNGALFWTGMPESEANRIAGGMHGTTLEQTLRERGTDLPPWKPDDPELSEAWETVSRRFAQEASGEVRVIMGPNPRPNSEWLQTELPALRLNPNVTRIIQIDAKTGAETVIFVR